MRVIVHCILVFLGQVWFAVWVAGGSFGLMGLVELGLRDFL